VGDSNTPATVVLTASSDRPVPGGHLILLPHTSVPAGFVGAVASVADNGDGSVIVATVPTTIGDALIDLRSSYEGPLASARMAAAVPSSRIGIGTAIDFGNCKAPGLTVSGGLDVTSVDGRFDLSLSARTLVVEITVGLTAKASVAAASGASCTFEIDPPGWLQLGPVAQLNPVIKVKVAATATATATSSITVPVTLGLEAGPDGVINRSNVDLDGTGELSAPLAAQLEVSALLTGELTALGRIGGSMGIGPVVRGKAEVAEPAASPCFTLDAFGRVSFDAKLDLWLKDWSINLAQFDSPPLELYKSECGANYSPWTGTIKITEEQTSTDPSYDLHAVTSSTYTLSPAGVRYGAANGQVDWVGQGYSFSASVVRDQVGDCYQSHFEGVDGSTVSLDLSDLYTMRQGTGANAGYIEFPIESIWTGPAALFRERITYSPCNDLQYEYYWPVYGPPPATFEYLATFNDGPPMRIAGDLDAHVIRGTTTGSRTFTDDITNTLTVMRYTVEVDLVRAP
jgi:hypothetical protein